MVLTSSCRPFGVGTPKGSVARLVMIMDLLDIHGLEKTEFGLGMRFSGPHGIGPHAVGALQDWNRPFLPKKRPFLESKPQLSSVFCTFLGSPWTCNGNSKPDPPKIGCEVKFGRRGKLTCHRIDEFSKQNWPPETQTGPPDPPRPPGDPQTPLQEV